MTLSPSGRQRPGGCFPGPAALPDPGAALAGLPQSPVVLTLGPSSALFPPGSLDEVCVLETWSLNHWTSREVLIFCRIFDDHHSNGCGVILHCRLFLRTFFFRVIYF